MSAMRIVSWNCRQGFDAKATALLALAPDLAVVPESHQTPAVALDSLFEKPVPHLWTGTIPGKGLGIFAPGAVSLERVTPDKESPGAHSVAGRALHALHGKVETIVIGVWTVPHVTKGDPYLAAASSIAERYATILATGHAILAGDFNISGRTCLAGLTAFSQSMRERFGMVSAFHAYHGVPIGGENVGTLWWRGDETQAFHCDFVFVPATWKITRVEVGAYAAWGSATSVARSDHAPVIVDVAR